MDRGDRLLPAPGLRLLFAFVGGRGHFDPLVPLAVAARAAGHDVLGFACRPSMVGEVAAAEFAAAPVGPDVPETSDRTALLRPDPAREEKVMRRGFAGVTARRRAAELIALGRDLRPDILVADEVDFGAFVAAEALGLPYASVIVLAAGRLARAEVIAEPLAELRATVGLAADPEPGTLHRHVVIAPMPPSFRDPAHPLPVHTIAIRPASLERAHTDHPWPAASSRPKIYVTLGTIFNRESGDLFERLIDAAGGVDADVLVTTGGSLDPDAFGPQPEHVRVERYVPQAAVLPSADLVVSHGGSGSVIGALAHGVPLVLLPMGADQLDNARRCTALGVGRTLDPLRTSASELRHAFVAVLGDERYRMRAQRLATEASALPGPEHAMRVLEAVAAH